jgi:DNA processing protein
MSSPHACPSCLRRARLLAQLAPYIERAAVPGPASRSAELLRLSNEDLVAAVAPHDGVRLLEAAEAASEESLFASLAAAQCWACCRHDPLYPAALREAPGAPWALIGRGEASMLAEIAERAGVVAVVGARRASAYGREVARTLGRELAGAGIVVVSGMAFGVDACAHRGALEEGRTVAVLGCGPDVAYPAAHRSLWRRVQERGLVLSELPPGTGAWRWSFPARSRIMAALAGMTVVVEAAARSGSLVTARIACDLGREVGAVPGPITSRVSAGANDLIAEGAYPIRDLDDILAPLLVDLGRADPPHDEQGVGERNGEGEGPR